MATRAPGWRVRLQRRSRQSDPVVLSCDPFLELQGPLLVGARSIITNSGQVRYSHADATPFVPNTSALDWRRLCPQPRTDQTEFHLRRSARAGVPGPQARRRVSLLIAGADRLTTAAATAPASR